MLEDSTATRNHKLIPPLARLYNSLMTRFQVGALVRVSKNDVLRPGDAGIVRKVLDNPTGDESLQEYIVEFGERVVDQVSDEGFSEHFIGCSNAAIPLPLYSPGLIVDLRPCKRLVLRPRRERLHIRRKIRDGISARLPFRHLKINEADRLVGGNGDVHGDLEQMRGGMGHRQPVRNRIWLRGL